MKSSGINHWNWKGGREITKQGYVRVYFPGHPKSHKGKIFEHVYVMEKHLGRFLFPGERVHHKNHDKSDNRLSNLQLFTNQAQHMSVHGKDRKTHNQICIRCGGNDVEKCGFKNYNKKVQQWHCKSCNRSFSTLVNIEPGYVIFNGVSRFTDGIKCSYCSSENIQRRGTRNNKQRWKCNICNRRFQTIIV